MDFIECLQQQEHVYAQNGVVFGWGRFLNWCFKDALWLAERNIVRASIWKPFSGNSGLTTPEKEKSDNSGDDSFNSGDDSSDSGLSTPPFLKNDLFSKKSPNSTKISKQISDDIFKRRIIGRTRTKSE